MKKTAKTNAPRTVRVEIRMTPAEAEQIAAAAKAAHLPVGTWLRVLGLKAAAALALLLAASSAQALDRWTWQDTAWEGAAVTALALDWGQTRDLAWRNGHTHQDGRVRPYHNEANPFLGQRPSRAKVDAYFASTIIGHAALASVLPARWRRAWQASALGLEVVVVGRNAQMNLRVRF